MASHQENSPNQQSQEMQSPWRQLILKLLSFKIFLVLMLIIGIGVYVMTAPPLEPSKELPKFHFQSKAAVRKRPTMDSKPIAYLEGTTELLASQGEWLQVRVEGEVKGWTQQHEGEIIPPPPPLPTSRQRAKQRLLQLIDEIRGLF